jgi:hypothetical protein
MAYQPGIPTGSVPLNQDFLNIQGNFGSLNTQFNVDHVPLTDTSGTPPNGYHTFVHLVPFSTTVTNFPNNQPVVAPAATPGYGQLFGATINDGKSTDSALYYKSGGGLLTQLTRNIQPVATDNGYTFLPGGLIFQWGFTNNITNGAVITFNTPFTQNGFNMQLTARGSAAPGSIFVSNIGTLNWTFGITGVASSASVYWTAIGI